MTGRRRPAVLVVAVAAGAKFVWWEGTRDRSSGLAHWSIGLSIALVILVSLVAGRGRQPELSATWMQAGVDGVRHWRDAPPTAVISVLGWTVLVAAIVGWGLASFLAQAHDLPTFSSLVGKLTRWHWGRSVVFGAWLLIGLTLAWDNRTSRP